MNNIIKLYAYYLSEINPQTRELMIRARQLSNYYEVRLNIYHQLNHDDLLELVSLCQEYTDDRFIVTIIECPEVIDSHNMLDETSVTSMIFDDLSESIRNDFENQTQFSLDYHREEVHRESLNDFLNRRNRHQNKKSKRLHNKR